MVPVVKESNEHWQTVPSPLTLSPRQPGLELPQLTHSPGREPLEGCRDLNALGLCFLLGLARAPRSSPWRRVTSGSYLDHFPTAGGMCAHTHRSMPSGPLVTHSYHVPGLSMVCQTW